MMKYLKIYESFESSESDLVNVSRDEYREKIDRFGYDLFTEGELSSISLRKNKEIRDITPSVYNSTKVFVTNTKSWSITVDKLDDEWYVIVESPYQVFGLDVYYIIDGFEDLLKYLAYINEEEIMKKQIKLRRNINHN